MRRVLAVSLMGLLMTASTTFAADQEGAAVVAPAAMASAVTIAGSPEQTAASIAFARHFNQPKRPMVLPALYGMTAALQGYDAYSTLTVLKAGGVEANPVMKGVTKSPVAFIGLKAGVAAMSIMASERMWKNHNRVGAIVTMAVTNGLMTAVAANNAKVMSRVK